MNIFGANNPLTTYVAELDEQTHFKPGIPGHTTTETGVFGLEK